MQEMKTERTKLRKISSISSIAGNTISKYLKKIQSSPVFDTKQRHPKAMDQFHFLSFKR